MQFFFLTLEVVLGTSLPVQWLRLHASNAEGVAGDTGLSPGQGTKISQALRRDPKEKSRLVLV